MLFPLNSDTFIKILNQNINLYQLLVLQNYYKIKIETL